MRFFAAWLVFHSHQYSVNGLAQPRLLILGFDENVGTLGVYVFFALSGYLVTGSAVSRGVWSFLWSRFLRIQPALTVCVIVTVGGGAAVSSLPISTYIFHAETIDYLHNILLPFIHPRFVLPGVFSSMPSRAVDIPFWTIPYEVACYALSVFVVLSGRWAVCGLLSLFSGLLIYNAAHGVLLSSPDRVIVSFYNDFDLAYLGVYGLLFFLAGSARLLSGPQLRRLVACAFWGLILSGGNDLLRATCWLVLIGSGTIFIAGLFDLDRLVKRVGDVSYGFYLYAYPIQQITASVVGVGGGRRFVAGYAVALLSSIAIAKLSWELVERPLLGLKVRRTDRQ